MSTDMIDEPAAVVTHAPAGDTYLVGVVGDVDYDSATELEAALRSAVTEPSCERTVVDLSGTDFADSTILNVLLSAQQLHRRAGRPMFVAGPFSRTLHRLFDVTGTVNHFTLVPTVADARART
jgi:anti-anti-sigma factor